MASDNERDGAAVKVFPPAVPVVTVLLGVALQRLWPLPSEVAFSAPLRHWIGGGVIAAAVIGLGLWSVVLFRRSGQNENPWKPTPQIVERGPFRITRNPMYLQMVLACIGFSILLANLWILVLTPLCGWALHVLAIVPEEAYLTGKFGEPYLEYQRRVRRWL